MPLESGRLSVNAEQRQGRGMFNPNPTEFISNASQYGLKFNIHGAARTDSGQFNSTGTDRVDLLDLNKKVNLYWNLEANGSTFFLRNSRENEYLKDDNGTLVLTDVAAPRGDSHKWALTNAGGGKFFIASHRNQYLTEDVLFKKHGVELGSYFPNDCVAEQASNQEIYGIGTFL